MTSEFAPRPGDRVAVYCWGSYSPTARFDTVERLTATQIILADGSRWKRSNLREVGSTNRNIVSELRSPTDRAVLDVRARAQFLQFVDYVRKQPVSGSWGQAEIAAVLADIQKAVDITSRKVAGVYALGSDS